MDTLDREWNDARSGGIPVHLDAQAGDSVKRQKRRNDPETDGPCIGADPFADVVDVEGKKGSSHGDDPRGSMVPHEPGADAARLADA